MAWPSYAGLDIGLPNGSLYPNQADSDAQETVADITMRRGDFAFHGLDGAFQRQYGAQPRLVTWSGILRTVTATKMQEIADSIESTIRRGAEATLTLTDGTVFSNVIIQRFTPGVLRTIRGGTRDGWRIREYELVFRIAVP